MGSVFMAMAGHRNEEGRSQRTVAQGGDVVFWEKFTGRREILGAAPILSSIFLNTVGTNTAPGWGRTASLSF